MLLACLLILQVQPPEASEEATAATVVLADLLEMVEAAPSPEAGVAAWEEFVAQIDWWRQTGTPYDFARFDPPRFQARLAQAHLLTQVQPTSAELMVKREGYLITYLDQFQEQEPPEGVFALNDGLGAHHDLALLRRDLGSWHRRDGDTTRALDIWTEARDLLRRILEEQIGQDVATGDRRVDAHSPWITTLTALYLELVQLAEGPEAYAAAAEAAAHWVPHDDNHVVITQMRKAGWDLSQGGEHLEAARRLLALVRAAHRERWNGAYATYADNMSALLAGIRTAIKLGHLDEARALLEEALGLIHDVEPAEVRDYLMSRIAGLLAEFSRESWLDASDREQAGPVDESVPTPQRAGGRSPPRAGAPPVRVPPTETREDHPGQEAAKEARSSWLVVLGAGGAGVFAIVLLVAALRWARRVRS